ncbi:hypothetical protein SAMN04487948_10120 [Halogranum amylolyticum]|uniref:Uncharacterized protein n=1 Tax=Halogranum amylolyticum TaxID=660520 RepID=A0A1H8MQI4_9EURY|nr:hypothetical protein SAMN04487948_10120 [Halogranum amylolyticum]
MNVLFIVWNYIANGNRIGIENQVCMPCTLGDLTGLLERVVFCLPFERHWCGDSVAISDVRELSRCLLNGDLNCIRHIICAMCSISNLKCECVITRLEIENRFR